MSLGHIRSSQFTIEENLNTSRNILLKFNTVKIEYKVNYNGVKISGAGMMEFHSTCLECRLLWVQFLTMLDFFSVVDSGLLMSGF